jgi:hypothetical protein
MTAPILHFQQLLFPAGPTSVRGLLHVSLETIKDEIKPELELTLHRARATGQSRQSLERSVTRTVVVVRLR